MSRLAILACERRVGDLADERLHERELAALGRARIHVPDDELPAGERDQPSLDIRCIERRHRRQPVDRERLAKHRGRLEERPVGGLEGVEPRGDERVQRLGHGQVGEITDRTVGIAG
jgi:hypothetical protein